ncbi:nose resistant to fluoxetine protein 6-like [Xenia sp. Carnegie-2017]|uniref:nose resistant to fluoxetine protein 6-like n=1 Tax=Xenia sp. Carnegie-2017 TaxID=2897299 RepID=UPI001F04F78D|nr:nose resistant to fluoxetine protein 6-like [Xenia sp. Carnegie-2017]
MAVPSWIANISRISNTLFCFCVFFQVPCLLAGRYSYELPEYVVKVDSKQLKMPKAAMDVAVDHLVKQFYETDIFTKSSQNISTCRKELINVTKNNDNLFLYVDAIGKVPAGISRGDFAWLGSFDSCLEITNAHYCLTTFNVEISNFTRKPLPLRIGFCLPSACGKVDLKEVFGTISISNQFVNITYGGCSCPKKPDYTSDVVITLVLCGFLLMLCALGTLMDVCGRPGVSLVSQTVSNKYVDEVSSSVQNEEVLHNERAFHEDGYNQHNKNHIRTPLVSESVKSNYLRPKRPSGGLIEFLRCFSLTRNTNQILDTKVTSKAITCLSGIRVISMFWVILGHAFLFTISSTLVANPLDMEDAISRLSMMAVTNAYYSVDTFFFLSGLLLAYVCFQKMEKNDGKYNWLLFYVHRYVRLTPSLMFMILFYMKLIPFFAYSPIWSTTEDKYCSRYWWTNLLYINNFYPTDFLKQCAGWSWYLANDMQFFVISPLILILAYRFCRVGLLATAGSLLMASTMILAVLYGNYDIDPTELSKWGMSNLFGISETRKNYSNMIYSKPYCRVQPYLIGIMLGYFMFRSYSGTRKPTWAVALIAWLVAFTVGMTLVYSPHDNVTDGRQWTKTEKVLYGMFSKVAWSMALAWVVYACHYGYGGIIQRFLSASFWVPLARLTYCAYLVHPIVLTYMFNSSKVVLFYSVQTIAFNFVAAVTASYLCAYILAVVIEFPCQNLEKLGARR